MIVVDYQVVSANHVRLLVSGVAEWIERGYEPLGGPIMSDGNCLLQALIKRAESAESA